MSDPVKECSSYSECGLLVSLERMPVTNILFKKPDGLICSPLVAATDAPKL